MFALSCVVPATAVSDRRRHPEINLVVGAQELAQSSEWVSGMSVNLVPRNQSQLTAASLDTLALNFSLHQDMVAKLKTEGLQDLEEFRFFFDSEDHVGRWVSKLGLGDATLLQTARVRRAWSAVGLYFQQAEQDRSKVALADRWGGGTVRRIACIGTFPRRSVCRSPGTSGRPSTTLSAGAGQVQEADPQAQRRGIAAITLTLRRGGSRCFTRARRGIHPRRRLNHPFEQVPVLDTDLMFAAQITAPQHGQAVRDPTTPSTQTEGVARTGAGGQWGCTSKPSKLWRSGR